MRTVTADRALPKGRRSVSPEILKWAQKARYEYLACRDVKHAWPADPDSLRWSTANHQQRRVWARPQVWCLHECGVSRIQRKDFITRERTTQYIYPTEDGERSAYLLPPGCGAMNADDIFELQLALSEPAKPKTKATPSKATESKAAQPKRKVAARRVPAKPPTPEFATADEQAAGRVRKAS